MELEKQIVSLELAKKLKELGIKQESLFWWIEHNDLSSIHYIDCMADLFESDTIFSSYCAFTTSELGEMLPETLARKNPRFGDHPCEEEFEDYFLTYNAYGMPYYENTLYDFNLNFMDYHDEETEADARAKMLIYLIENKLMEIPNV